MAEPVDAPGLEDSLGSQWPPPVDDPFTEAGVPEVAAADLDADLLNAGLQHRGCLLVRGLLAPDVAAALLGDLQQSFAASEAHAQGAPLAATAPWYVPFEPDPRYSFGAMERAFSREIGGVLSVESPRALFRVIEALKGANIDRLLTDYFGDVPTLSAKKSTLRRARPTSPTEWHQDGAFLGTGTRTVNSWIALTRCGRDAPGIDVFAKAFDDIVETGTDNALFDWSVSPQQAERIGTSYVVRPEFEPGDALLFNQMTLHRSGIDPSMAHDRYAIESWFFATSTYPYEQVPILF